MKKEKSVLNEWVKREARSRFYFLHFVLVSGQGNFIFIGEKTGNSVATGSQGYRNLCLQKLSVYFGWSLQQNSMHFQRRFGKSLSIVPKSPHFFFKAISLIRSLSPR